MSRHAHRVPVYSVNGGARPLIYISKKRAQELQEAGEARRISRVKDPNLVLRFGGLQRQPRVSSSALTSKEMELNALSQVLASDGSEESRRVKRITEKVAAWPFVGDEKAPLASAGRAPLA